MQWGSKFEHTIAKVKVALFLGISAAWAQSISVYSEFVRIDQSGRVVAPETPREILSPAIVRNGFTSFQIAVQAEAGLQWKLYVGQNPDNAVRLTLYRKSSEALEKVSIPVEGEGSQVFWMDVWTERTAPVQRIKIEPELYARGDWVTYPMEARVMEARAPDAGPGGSIHSLLCGGAAPAAPTSDVAKLQFRNAQQDAALAERASKDELKKDELKKLYGACDAAPPADNPEWYLRIRDYLFRLR